VTLVSLQDLRAARTVIGDRLVRTPLVHFASLSALTGARVSLKLELFQHTGSFKPRGVLNAVEALTPDERARGVISISAGNHAQALAWAAAAIGVSATIVMPATAVRAKVDATRALGGEVIQTDADLLATAKAIQQERSLTFVHPFDDPVVIAGAGTLGLEIAEDAPDVDLVIVGCGGGLLPASLRQCAPCAPRPASLAWSRPARTPCARASRRENRFASRRPTRSRTDWQRHLPAFTRWRTSRHSSMK
jgi:threonine dehydratase